ncbi:tetratricopeptide repeat protein [Tenacibaculum aestuarii]|uniref:tetratricopeptide repeat protein n=1 Tax=Tenacibaculum aestuarii TaxID=362781 RepID=UPI003894432E
MLITSFLLLTNFSFSQIAVDITDIKSNKTISFSKIFSEYNIKKELPTLVITWSGKWCDPCVKLINRYNQCDLSMVNIITVNVDRENSLNDVLKQGIHLKWKNSLNFHANLGKGKKGFDNVFNTSLAPLILYLDNGKISDALINYNIFPYRLIETGRVKDVQFIWNSSDDLNSLAWSYYKNNNSPEKLEEAIKWIIRSIELNKNYYNLDTYAALLFKTGKHTEALKKAKEAIEKAKEDNKNYNSTTELINKIIEKL